MWGKSFSFIVVVVAEADNCLRRNLSWNTNDDQLREVYASSLPPSTATDPSFLSSTQAFCKYGNVVDCIAMKDRETGRARGFGFVTFSTGEEAQNAISNMHDRELDGRSLRVNPAVSFLFLFPLSFSFSFCF
ncbi:hypothetical protein B0H14DRAFT_2786933, partial [Mycena olivaceomarginata]